VLADATQQFLLNQKATDLFIVQTATEITSKGILKWQRIIKRKKKASVIKLTPANSGKKPRTNSENARTIMSFNFFLN
jgi:hypothetical protein